MEGSGRPGEKGDGKPGLGPMELQIGAWGMGFGDRTEARGRGEPGIGGWGAPGEPGV